MKQVEAAERQEVWLKTSGLTLHLEASLFLPHVWEQVWAWFRGGGEQAWLRAPFRVMTAEAAGPNQPRWKQMSVDGLSWLIFLLLVPAHHPLVKLWQVIDWGAINRLCQECYQNSQRGQRAWAPVQLFSLLVLFFVLPVASETSLIQTVALVPLYRWFCGFALFSPLPDHSTLYTFRQRLGAARFEAILTWLVQQCDQQGLLAQELAFFDMTGVEASARPWSPYERAVLLTYGLVRYLELAAQGQTPEAGLSETVGQLAAEVALEVLDNKPLKAKPKIAQRVLRSLAHWRKQRQQAKGQAFWQLSLEETVQSLLAELGSPTLEAEASQQRAWLKKIAQALKARLPHARGDLAAGLGWVSSAVMKCGYWLGFLVDSLHQVITVVRVVSLSVDQRSQLLPALDQHQQHLGRYPKAVVTDSAQDFDPVHQGLAERQIEGHIASRAHSGGGGGLNSAHFTFDEQGQLLCPNGQVMQPGATRRDDGRVAYRAKDCATCPRKLDCLPKGQQPDGPRLIQLEPAAHHRWQQNRQHCRTDAYKAAQRRRFVSEGLFGLARRLYGADKMPYRSIAMNQIAGLLIGSVMNWAVLARRRT